MIQAEPHSTRADPPTQSRAEENPKISLAHLPPRTGRHASGLITGEFPCCPDRQLQCLAQHRQIGITRSCPTHLPKIYARCAYTDTCRDFCYRQSALDTSRAEHLAQAGFTRQLGLRSVVLHCIRAAIYVSKRPASSAGVNFWPLYSFHCLPPMKRLPGRPISANASENGGLPNLRGKLNLGTPEKRKLRDRRVLCVLRVKMRPPS